MAGETATGGAGDQDPSAESPPASEETPESFGKVESVGPQRVPLERLNQVIAQRNSAQGKGKELAERVERLEAQLQETNQPPQVPGTGAMPVHRLDLRAEELRSKARVARSEGDHELADDMLYEAGKAASGNITNAVLTDYTQAEQAKAQEHLWAEARNAAADKIAQEFPWMQDVNSPERMRAYNLWNQSPWLKSNPEGEYYAAQQVQLDLLNTAQLPGAVTDKPPVSLDAGAPRPTATGHPQRSAQDQLDAINAERDPTLRKNSILEYLKVNKPWERPTPADRL